MFDDEPTSRKKVNHLLFHYSFPNLEWMEFVIDQENCFPMPIIEGVLETALYVEDLNRSEEFYRRLFGFPVLLTEDRMRALRVPGQNAQGHQVLLLFRIGGSLNGESAPGGFIPSHDGNGKLHMAFSIGAEELDVWRKQLQEDGVEIESEVQANSGHSLYFRDPDGHLIELATPGLWDVGQT